MARPPGLWRRSPGGPWYTTLAGRQRKVAEAAARRSEARAALDRLLAAEGRPGAGRAPSLTVRQVCNLFLAALEAAVARGDRAAHTFDGYRRHLKGAVRAFGGIRAADLKPLHVARWLDATAWGPTTRNGAITAVKAVMNWARRQGYLATNPIAELERPAARRREAVLTEAQADAVLAAVPDREFRDLLVALRETGARPGEVAGLTAAGVDLQSGTWRVRNKTARKTGEETRTVHLTPVALEITRRLVAEHPEGPLFRNRRGHGWTRNAMACRCADLRRRLGLGPELSAYAFRHLFATTALERGVPIATVAALMGHTDTNMISRQYSKLARATEHLKDAARAARGADQ